MPRFSIKSYDNPSKFEAAMAHNLWIYTTAQENNAVFYTKD